MNRNENESEKDVKLKKEVWGEKPLMLQPNNVSIDPCGKRLNKKQRTFAFIIVLRDTVNPNDTKF